MNLLLPQPLLHRRVGFDEDGFCLQEGTRPGEVPRGLRTCPSHGNSAGRARLANGRRVFQILRAPPLGSGKHRRNIEGEYRYTGVGVVRAPNGAYYYTQMFVR